MPDEIKNSSFMKKLNRRDFLMISAGLAAGYFIALSLPEPPDILPKAKVAIVKVPKYTVDIKNLLRPYFKQFNLNLANKQVLLKPNIVDYHGSDQHIYTHPDIMLAAIELFLDHGAKVTVAEGSGIRRDINTILYQSDYKNMLKKYSVEFVDLNMDDVVKVRNVSKLTGYEHLFFPKTVIESDYIVSMPKLKTHHWMGVTLSLKNMFGIMPGTKYGWPKNKLHVAGVDSSILDINYTIRPHFTIVDGVIGIEGNGPLFGNNKYAGVVVMSNDLLAADFVCSKIMGVNPDIVPYLARAKEKVRGNIALLGNTFNIEIIGASINSVKQNFDLLQEFEYLRL